MKRIKQLILGILFSYMLFFHISSSVWASQFNFGVTTLPAESQIDKDKTYYDLKLAPNTSEILDVELRNDTNEEVEVGISVNSTTTNSNVSVEYGENNLLKDESLVYDIADYVNYPDSVTLAPKSSKVISFEVKMPDDSFDGMIAGGITFKEINLETSSTSDEQNLSIQNEYSYVVALLMRQTLEPVTPNLNLKEVKPDQINARNVISALLQNDQKTYINQVAIETKISKKNSSEVMYHEEKSGLQIAPNSHFYFPTALNGEALKAGDYHLSTIVYGNPEDTGEFTHEIEGEMVTFGDYWQFEEDFTITGTTAKELNKKDVSIEKDYSWLYIVIVIIMVLLILILSILLFRSKKRNEIKDSSSNKE